MLGEGQRYSAGGEADVGTGSSCAASAAATRRDRADDATRSKRARRAEPPAARAVRTAGEGTSALGAPACTDEGVMTGPEEGPPPLATLPFASGLPARIMEADSPRTDSFRASRRGPNLHTHTAPHRQCRRHAFQALFPPPHTSVPPAEWTVAVSTAAASQFGPGSALLVQTRATQSQSPGRRRRSGQRSGVAQPPRLRWRWRQHPTWTSQAPPMRRRLLKGRQVPAAAARATRVPAAPGAVPCAAEPRAHTARRTPSPPPATRPGAARTCHGTACAQRSHAPPGARRTPTSGR